MGDNLPFIINMEKIYWKLLAIFFIVITILETSLIICSVVSYQQDIDDELYCFYDVCSDYPDATYENNVCYCYDYDYYGNPKLTKTEYMK